MLKLSFYIAVGGVVVFGVAFVITCCPADIYDFMRVFYFVCLSRCVGLLRFIHASRIGLRLRSSCKLSIRVLTLTESAPLRFVAKRARLLGRVVVRSFV